MADDDQPTTQKASPQEPGLESKVIKEDAPLDHGAVKKGLTDAIYEIGAGDKGIEPVKTTWFQSGKVPSDTSYFWVGSDRRVYGKGQKLPDGVAIEAVLRAATLLIHDEWQTRMFIIKEGETGWEEIAGGDSGSGDTVPFDPTDPGSAPGKYTWQSRELYAARDPKTSARQALNELQTRGFLNDPVRHLYLDPRILKIALGLAVFGLGFFLYSSTTKKEGLPPLPPVSFEADGAYTLDGRKYYAVKAADPAGDTGDEVCTRVGKSCVGYTALSLAVCQAFHPTATPSEDFNGSRAGFYCNGPPQGGICGEERNTCHICPACNLNMECGTVIGDLYNETFVECR